jgi:ATP-dependent DNA ligase
MEALSVDELPPGKRWLFKPKYDGFRGILFRDDGTVNLQSRRQRPLGCYFPEIIEAASLLTIKRIVLDSEPIIPDQPFDTLQLRLHPAVSRVQLLSRQHPAQIVASDLLADEEWR